MKTLFKTIGLLLIFSLASCTKEYVAPADVPTSATFATDIQPIFTDNCISCHGGGGTSPNLTSGKAYSSLMSNNLVDTTNAENSILYKRLTGNGVSIMPPSGKLPANEINKVLVWIKDGAKDN